MYKFFLEHKLCFVIFIDHYINYRASTKKVQKLKIVTILKGLVSFSFHLKYKKTKIIIFKY